VIDYSQKHEDAAAYMPTEEEIAEGCAEIQKGWGQIEKNRRRVVKEPTWDVPTCRGGTQ
jgi:hypothetical protein